jgi:hypothetical protein
VYPTLPGEPLSHGHVEGVVLGSRDDPELRRARHAAHLRRLELHLARALRGGADDVDGSVSGNEGNSVPEGGPVELVGLVDHSVGVDLRSQAVATGRHV